MQRIHTEPVSDTRRWSVFDIDGEIYIAPSHMTHIGWCFMPGTLIPVKDPFPVERAKFLIKTKAEKERAELGNE